MTRNGLGASEVQVAVAYTEDKLMEIYWLLGRGAELPRNCLIVSKLLAGVGICGGGGDGFRGQKRDSCLRTAEGFSDGHLNEESSENVYCNNSKSGVKLLKNRTG